MAKSKSRPTPKLTKSALLNELVEQVGDGVTRSGVKAIVEAMVAVGHRELKKAGVFVVPGFAKFVVVKKPARPTRKGINPFTKEPTIFAAKPASKTVRARPVKAVKDAVA